MELSRRRVLRLRRRNTKAELTGTQGNGGNHKIILVGCRLAVGCRWLCAVWWVGGVMCLVCGWFCIVVGGVLWLVFGGSVVCCGWCVLGLWCAVPEGNGKYIWLSDCNKRQCWAAATGAATQQCWRSDGRPQGALSSQPGSRRTLSQH